MLKTAPAVFAVERTYRIMVQVTAPALFWVRIGDREYYDESNGILRSLEPLHTVAVPMDVLDNEGKYTVCLRPIKERKPYFTQTHPIREYTYAFRPLPDDRIRLYHISDAHNRVEAPIAAAKTFGDIDALILNGDILNHAGDPSKFDNVYELCGTLTNGQIPVVFSRGNHDMRGNHAEAFAKYAPNANGHTYYTFRLGSLWGVILDCAEDKPDDHEEYGHTVVCHHFRLAQTAFLRSVIARASEEYAADGIKTRLVICHNPFVKVLEPPFNIEQDVYTEWSRLLHDHIRPHAMISGHLHQCFVQSDAVEGDLPFPCPLVVGSKPDEDHFTGCGITIEHDGIHVCFTNDQGERSEDGYIPTN